MTVYDEVQAERADNNNAIDLMGPGRIPALIKHHAEALKREHDVYRLTDRQRYVRVAAYCVAAIEAIDQEKASAR